MVRTRAAEAREKNKSTTGKKELDVDSNERATKKREANEKAKDLLPKKEKTGQKGTETKSAAVSTSREETNATGEEPASESLSKIQKLLSSYGTLPLENLSMPSPAAPSPSNVLALLLNALLSSARISHELADRSEKYLIEAGYQDLDTLESSTWEERTEVLTKGGYTRYREKTATALGNLAELVRTEYDGDLNNLLGRASSSPDSVRKLLKDIKGLGDMGVDIFLASVQGMWPDVAPFLDKRNLETAKEIGIGSDVKSLWKAVGENHVEMCKLSSALTTVRLDKKQGDFK